MKQDYSDALLIESEPKLKEACGVVGILFKNGYEHKDKTEASYLTYLALNALQHRGQESCGIASFDDLSQKCHSVLEMGLISQAFSEEKLESLKGHLAIGHVRYSTAGQSEICNAQPIIKNSKNFGYTALAHNGNLVNSTQLIERVEGKGYFRQSNSDSELLSYLMKEFINSKDTVEVLEALRLAFSEARGAFSLSVALGGKFLIGVRDHQGLRPLELGAIEQDGEIIAYVLVSETCGLDIMGARYIREVQPGEILLIDENLNIHSTFLSNINPKLCLFELIYFARPDSIMKGIQVNEYREELGRILALNSPVPDADVVVGVPDSGTPAAIGFSKQSGIPFVQGLIKNRYVGRTFIQPTQSIRQLGIKLKLNPLPNVIRGKSVVLVDDSIVRGNTPGQLVKLLKQAGAKEVHLRISSPPIMWGCFYGIAMKSDELIARRLEGQIDRIKNEVGADSLAYLNLANALKVTNRNQKEFCTACFNGDYPVFVSDQSAEKENPHVSNSHLSESESTQAVLI